MRSNVGCGSTSVEVLFALRDLLASFGSRYSVESFLADNISLDHPEILKEQRVRLLAGDPTHCFALGFHANFIRGAMAHFTVTDIMPKSNSLRFVQFSISVSRLSLFVCYVTISWCIFSIFWVRLYPHLSTFPLHFSHSSRSFASSSLLVLDFFALFHFYLVSSLVLPL